MKFRAIIAITLLLGSAGSLAAEEPAFKPFVLASVGSGTLQDEAQEVSRALESAGFRVVGEHSPTPDSRVIVVTSEALLRAAAQSERGGYAAAERVSVATASNGDVEVAFVNPVYLQYAYRLSADLEPVYQQLTAALGHVRECGAGDKQMTAKKLRNYHYMIGMQRFDDPSELGSYDSHEAAVAAVEAGLARPGDGLDQVYRIDIPGDTPQTLIGVAMKGTGDEDEHIDEAAQLAVVDFQGCRKVAYFPYEILVNGNEVEALHMRFRMAVHFPDLSMMGKHGFTKLMPYPGDIEDALAGLLVPR